MMVLIDLIENQMTKHITFTSSQTDHPPSITKQLPRSIEKHLSQLSPSKDIFYKTTPYYEQRPANCGYNEKLTYQQNGENNENNKNIGKNRKRNIIWFNPPYSKSLKTNIGKYLFRLLSKHFPPMTATGFEPTTT